MNPADEPPRENRWENRDADVWSLFAIALLLLICVVAMVLVAGGLLRMLKMRAATAGTPPPPAAAVAERAEFPEPRLQLAPRADMEKYRAAQERELATYGWIDKPRGVLRIPIERAMDVLAARGLPRTDQRVTPEQLQQQVPAERSAP